MPTLKCLSPLVRSVSYKCKQKRKKERKCRKSELYLGVVRHREVGARFFGGQSRTWILQGVTQSWGKTV